MRRAAPADGLAAFYRFGPLAFLPLERDGQQDWCSIVWSTTPEQIAQPAAAEIRKQFAALGKQYSTRPPVRLFYQVWDKPLYTLSSKSIVSDAIQLCGGVNKLLDKFGYKKGADGWRTLPDGKPLLIRYASRNEANGVLQAEMWRKTYNSLGIRMENDRMIFSDILKTEKQCKMQTRTAPWLADYPDGDNFMQLFYGPNTHQNNNGCYQDPDYDKWYAASQAMPASPERDELYHKMARRLEVNAGALIGYARYRNMLIVGAGMVGSALALALKDSGLKILLLDGGLVVRLAGAGAV